MYVSSARCWISCVPCGHINDNTIVPDGCQYIHWYCARNAPFYLFDYGGTSLRTDTKVQMCSGGPLECSGRCKVHIASSYCLQYRTGELPSLTAHECKNVHPTLNVMSGNGDSSLCIPCPLGKCGEGSLPPHAVQVTLDTDAWGAVGAQPASNGVLVDDQAHDRAAKKCCYLRKRHGELKWPLGEFARAQEGKDGVRPASRTFRIILIFPVTCIT